MPWRNFTHYDLAETEGYYASVLYAFFASLNVIIIPEDITNHGQADMTLLLADKVYVMEFKLDKTKAYRKKKVNPALKQIQDRQYSTKYLGQDKQVFEVGMIFNQTARNLVQMDWEKKQWNPVIPAKAGIYLFDFMNPRLGEDDKMMSD